MYGAGIGLPDQFIDSHLFERSSFLPDESSHHHPSHHPHSSHNQPSDHKLEPRSRWQAVERQRLSPTLHHAPSHGDQLSPSDSATARRTSCMDSRTGPSNQMNFANVVTNLVDKVNQIAEHDRMEKLIGRNYPHRDEYLDRLGAYSRHSRCRSRPHVSPSPRNLLVTNSPSRRTTSFESRSRSPSPGPQHHVYHTQHILPQTHSPTAASPVTSLHLHPAPFQPSTSKPTTANLRLKRSANFEQDDEYTYMLPDSDTTRSCTSSPTNMPELLPSPTQLEAMRIAAEHASILADDNDTRRFPRLSLSPSRVAVSYSPPQSIRQAIPSPRYPEDEEPLASPSLSPRLHSSRRQGSPMPGGPGSSLQMIPSCDEDEEDWC